MNSGASLRPFFLFFVFRRLSIGIALFIASESYSDIPPAHLRSFPEIVFWMIFFPFFLHIPKICCTFAPDLPYYSMRLVYYQ